MIRVVIADDHDLIRGGLKAILHAEPDLVVVGEAADGASAARVAASESADIVLMDVQMPGSDGIDGLHKLAESRPQARALMLTTFDLDEYVFAALRAGASGFLLKTTPPAELASAIRASRGGDLLFAPSVTRRLVEAYVRRPPTPGGVPMELSSLTQRELEVFRAVARGLSNAEISAALFMGEATVKSHVTRILAKLALRDRVQAVVLAYECGLAG
ncbi:MAG TPA: response regulator transcription factor [Microbacteriaceae bacterium]